jgi:hypothetical protein
LNTNDDDLVERIRRDLADAYDEELELELEDRNLDDLPKARSTPNGQHSIERAAACIFANCSALQG